jgi:hypothetical protein
MPSTVIRSFSYDERKQELVVVFQSRRRYVYRQVPEATVAAMKASTSKGAFFNRHIRDCFAFSRQDDEMSAGAPS